MAVSSLCRGSAAIVGFEDAALLTDNLGERRERDALSVRAHVPVAPDRELGLGLEVLSQLRDEPALADTRHADDRHELWGDARRDSLRTHR